VISCTPRRGLALARNAVSSARFALRLLFPLTCGKLNRITSKGALAVTCESRGEYCEGKLRQH
jgi:hypothetical protein